MAWLEDQCNPIIRTWFLNRFHAPSEPQVAGWPTIAKGDNILIAAPTGSGKTLAAFMVILNDLVEASLRGELTPGVKVIYVSPLKALSNDVEKNLKEPLEEISELFRHHEGFEPIRVALRTGDTKPYERQKLVKNPPHILVTTPESLYLLLTAEKSRQNLVDTKAIIVDEIHAMAGNKRGSHLALSISRLERLCQNPLAKIGLSATIKPLDQMAHFLVGQTKDGEPAACHIVETQMTRTLDLEIVTPDQPLQAVLSHEGWDEIYEKLTDLIQEHRSTLVFVNTRRLAERLTHQLSQKLGDDAVKSHHGSLSRERRLEAEQMLKSGETKAIIATASMELGIDVGFIDLVCQIGSPRSLAAFIQRIGRSGHSIGKIPKGRLFALTRDEMMECAALIHGIRQGWMDAIAVPQQPLDILCQQIIASIAMEELTEKDLLTLIRTAHPYRHVDATTLQSLLEILSNGMSESSRRGSYIHWDKTNGKIRPRKSARLSAVTSSGAIPEQNLYRVVIEADDTYIGTVDEDFAIESLKGDIFLLGNHSWQVQRVSQGKVLVADAGGAPPTIPFWFGEAPGRTYELSTAISDIRGVVTDQFQKVSKLDEALPAKIQDHLIKFFAEECGMPPQGASQLIHYCQAQMVAMGTLPSQTTVIFERFFDDTEGMQVVIHAPFGARVNRAFGLALRKRFCRTFDFELQALADDNGLVLSAGPKQSFPIEQLFSLLNSQNLKTILVQALLAAPMFQVRWRWNLTRSLAILRQKSGQRVPPHLQRFQADDLLTAVFPDQTQCAEHRQGDLEVPHHPLVQQTIEDCLTEAMDFDRIAQIIADVEAGRIEFIAKDTREASPFAHELLNANPYAFLDDAPLEERRARALALRRQLPLKELADLTNLSDDAITKIGQEAWPIVRDHDELFDALIQLLWIPAHLMNPWSEFLAPLQKEGRVGSITTNQTTYWFPQEKESFLSPLIEGLDTGREDAIRAIVRGHLESSGVISAPALTERLSLGQHEVQRALIELENQGLVVQGTFTPEARNGGPVEWCERRLLYRIHRLTVKSLRDQIEPATLEEFQYFLVHHQHAHADAKLGDEEGLKTILKQQQGFIAPLKVWEPQVLKNRLKLYRESSLDLLLSGGRFMFARVEKNSAVTDKLQGFRNNLPLTFVERKHTPLLRRGEDQVQNLPGEHQAIVDVLQQRGALFFQDLAQETNMLPTRLEHHLSDLLASGTITCDGFGAMRPDNRKPTSKFRRRRSPPTNGPFDDAGRISLINHSLSLTEEDICETWIELLFDRYGVLFKDLLHREPLAPKWATLLPYLRSYELKGEIFGGRFVKGIHGEQFADKAAVSHLRQLKKDRSKDEDIQFISACDPLNLTHLLPPEQRVPWSPANRLALRQGQVIATQIGDHFQRRVEDIGPISPQDLAYRLRVINVLK